MTQIEIVALKRNDSYIELSYKMRFVLPSIYGTGALPISGLEIILSSFPDGFSSEDVIGTGKVVVFNKTESINLSVSLAQIKTALQNRYTAVRTKLDSLTLTTYDTIAGLSWDGTNWA